MSLIFHAFPNDASASGFALNVRGLWPGLETSVCSSQEHSNAIDPFPFALQPPIVLIDRPEDEDVVSEDEIEAFVKHYGGTFAGT